jgi:hypothetical protein
MVRLEIARARRGDVGGRDVRGAGQRQRQAERGKSRGRAGGRPPQATADCGVRPSWFEPRASCHVIERKRIEHPSQAGRCGPSRLYARPAGEIDEVALKAPARAIEFPAGRAAREMACGACLRDRWSLSIEVSRDGLADFATRERGVTEVSTEDA